MRKLLEFADTPGESPCRGRELMQRPARPRGPQGGDYRQPFKTARQADESAEPGDLITGQTLIPVVDRIRG